MGLLVIMWKLVRDVPLRDMRINARVLGLLCLLFAGLLFSSSPAGAGSGNSSSEYIAPNAGTTIPVYDTAWQMFALASLPEADEYFEALEANGFTGAWAGVIHHAPARYNDNFRGGGLIGELDANGDVVLTPGYIAHVRSILDIADSYDLKVGMVVAWQNLYLPGGRSDEFLAKSDLVRETIDTSNAYAYGQQMVEAFGDHPAVSMWVTGGDAGSNNTAANVEVWRIMTQGIRDAGSSLDITHHLPSSFFDHFTYVGEPWLDSISPEMGHIQLADETEDELIAVGEAYGIPVWQGEARYFNISFDWIPEDRNNPGVAEVEADAIAARNAGVTGYVYGDAGRWNWCLGFGDATPCDSANIADSFGGGEEATVAVFAADEPAPPVQPDVSRPVVVATSPADGWVISAGVRNLSGSASDNDSGVVRVQARIRRLSAGGFQYWNGTRWAAPVHWHTASLSTDGSWVVPNVNFDRAGSYQVVLAGLDAAGNISNAFQNPSADFTVGQPDVTGPVVVATGPADGSVLSTGVANVSGSASDDVSGVVRVRARVRRLTNGQFQYWNGNGWGSAVHWHTASLSAGGSWVVPNVNFNAAGAHQVLLAGLDASGNISNAFQNPETKFTVRSIAQSDVTGPVVTPVWPADGSVRSLGFSDILGSSSDDQSGVLRVRVRVRRASGAGIQYWNGVGWGAPVRWHTATVAGDGSWSLSGVNFNAAGSYQVFVAGLDNARNVSNAFQNPRAEFTVR